MSMCNIRQNHIQCASTFIFYFASTVNIIYSMWILNQVQVYPLKSWWMFIFTILYTRIYSGKRKSRTKPHLVCLIFYIFIMKLILLQKKNIFSATTIDEVVFRTNIFRKIEYNWTYSYTFEYFVLWNSVAEGFPTSLL